MRDAHEEMTRLEAIYKSAPHAAASNAVAQARDSLSEARRRYKEALQAYLDYTRRGKI
jgi:hypothetical protein